MMVVICDTQSYSYSSSYQISEVNGERRQCLVLEVSNCMRTNRTNNFENKTHFIKTLQIFSSKHEISTQNITSNFIQNITIYFTKILWLTSSKHYNSLHSNILTHLIKNIRLISSKQYDNSSKH